MTLTFPPPLPASPSRPIAMPRRHDEAPQAPAARTVTHAGIPLRPMTPTDAGSVRDFLMAQYEAFNAADNTAIGHGHFRAFVSTEALLDRLAGGNVAYVAARRGAILGMCELHLDGYLTLLYVRGDHQGRGLGRRLLTCGLESLLAAAPGIRTIRVRGTPYARGFYAHMGFDPGAKTVQEDHGIRFHPFSLHLKPSSDTDTDTDTNANAVSDT